MGGGSWNGKNFGGLHTGADKKQNSGPYSSDGYIRNPRVSHLDFVAGEEVIYIGSSKYKHKTNIPNGTKGTVLEKEGGLKSARSVLRIDFKEHGVRYFDELTNMAQLTEEVGEVARIIVRRYGEQSEKESDKTKDLGEELADVIFVVMCLANQTGVDLQHAFDKKMKIKSERDHQRHQNNPKLK